MLLTVHESFRSDQSVRTFCLCQLLGNEQLVLAPDPTFVLMLIQ
jgi:hypothetical protein